MHTSTITKIKLIMFLFSFQALSSDKSNKKSWSHRLKLNKSEKQPTSPQIFCDDNSMPSALSRSMKYTEPWFYGTMRGVPTAAIASNRPQAMFTPLREVAVVICSCPEYLNGTKKDFKKATICKKCRGSRLPLTPIGGTVRIHSTTPIVHAARGSAGTVRLPSYALKQRPTILNPDNDPYDMMRRSRLVSPELQPVNNVLKSSKNRAKSSSPSRSRSRTRKRTPSPKRQYDTRSRSASKKDDSIASCTGGNHNEWVMSDATDMASGRRSILQCDLSAYELISKISHNSEFSPLCDDDLYNMHSQKYENILNQSNSDRLEVTALAGQRIKLSGGHHHPSSQYGDVVDQFVYEKINNFTNNHSSNKDADQNQHTIRNGNLSPTRPPRRKHDNNPQSNNLISSSSSNSSSSSSSSIENESPETSLQNEYVLTAATLSHISKDMTPTNTIKSILKRPPSLTVPPSTAATTPSTTTTTIITSSTISIPSSYLTVDAKKDNKSSPNSMTQTSHKIMSKPMPPATTAAIVAVDNISSSRNATMNKLISNNNSISSNDCKEKDKRNSGSLFYLPMPQRKKVQFLVENEIINDQQQHSMNYSANINDDYDDDDDAGNTNDDDNHYYASKIAAAGIKNSNNQSENTYYNQSVINSDCSSDSKKVIISCSTKNNTEHNTSSIAPALVHQHNYSNHRATTSSATTKTNSSTIDNRLNNDSLDKISEKAIQKYASLSTIVAPSINSSTGNSRIDFVHVNGSNNIEGKCFSLLVSLYAFVHMQ